MKIGVIAHLKHAIRQPFAGGLEMHTHMLVRGLKARGHAVTLFATRDSAPELDAIDVCEEMRDHPSFFQAEHTTYLALMQRLRNADFDVIHNNSLHYLTVGMATSLPMPMVTTLHTPPFWEIEGSMRMCGAGASAYVAVSDYIAEAWTTIAPIEQVIRNGIDLNHFAARLQPDAAPYLAWCGRIVPEKGLHLAIAAARQAGCVLQIAGPISDLHYFRSQIEPTLGEAAIYRGHLDHDAVMRLMGGARAFICTPMWDEPYGLVIAEALACGTPVAAFARGAVAELIDSHCGLAVAPGDIDALATAAVRVQKLSRAACRRRAESVAGMAAMLDGYEALYDRLLQQHSRPATPLSQGLRLPQVLRSQDLLALYRERLPQLYSSVPASAEAISA